MATTTASETEPKTVRIVPKHHWLVRVTHWLNIPILLGMGVTGLAIYWASPVFHHGPDQQDYLADIGAWCVRHLPGVHGYVTTPTDKQSQHGISASTDFVYNHLSLGTGDLAVALNLHWLFAYLFMANGTLYLIGLVVGGGYRALLPRRTDIKDAFAMMRYYVGLLPAKLARRVWKHPEVRSKYNALQRGAYFSMPVFGLLAVATGWAIHKPQQLGWLQALFGGYDWARVWHFWIMWVFAAFVIPHVILVFADGWDTFRSMIVGWSDRVPKRD